jgi:hypothetical protein
LIGYIIFSQKFNQILHLMQKSNFFYLHDSLRAFVAVLILAVSAQFQAVAQCSMSCNSLVNISLDQNCVATILPDVVLEGDASLTCPSGVLNVQAKINGIWTPNVGNFVATSAHLGQTLEVRVRDLVSNNSCWGHVFIEDKLAPSITCTDLTISCAVSNYSPSALQALGVVGANPVATDNCSSATTSWSDVETIDVACGQTINGLAGMSYAVKRVWTVVDAAGNSTSCAQWIYFTRILTASIVFPADVTLDCTSADVSPAVAGAPYVLLGASPVYLYPNTTYCEVNASYADQVIPVCDGTRKILRTWTVMDWCAPTSAGVNPFYAVQLVKVIDDEGPTMACPVDATVSVDQTSCCATVNLPDFIVSDPCSRMKSATAVIETVDPISYAVLASYTVSGSFANFPGNNLWNPDTLAVFPNAPCLPVGTHRVTYAITDDCGNQSTCVSTLVVRDYIEPTVVCDEHTIVSVGGDDINDCYLPNAATCKFAGVTWVRASSFDDGSYDNCGGIKFTAQRMSPYSAFVNSLNQVNGFPDCNDATPDYVTEYERATSEGDSIKFYCDEVGTTQMVIFRAYQLNANGSLSLGADGNPIVNSCMVEVEVQDKLKPTCQSPANITVDCENFDPSLWAYGTPVVYDNCCLDVTKNYGTLKGVTHSANYSQFDTTCNRGIITRRFTVYDCAGNTSICTQRVVVTYNQDYFMRMPNDLIITDCNLTGNYGEPVIYDEDCELVGTSFVDEVVTVVPDACYKIIRKWRISNWCTYNADLPCDFIPNPNPNQSVNHAANLPGPKVTPYSAGNTTVPVEWRSTLVSITPGAPQTDYTIFWRADANCYEYNQVIKIIDNIAPVISNCPSAPLTLDDLTANNADLWNDVNFNDAVHNSHDLCEMNADLNIVTSDLCSGTNVSASYTLFLDTDNDGTMETVISSKTPPQYGFVNVGNAFNPNFAGGNPLQFDKRNVPANQLYGFTVQNTVAAGKKTARVAFNTVANQSNYVLPELPHGKHKIKWIVTDGCGNDAICEYNFTIKDGKAPTIVCLNGVAINIMPTGMIDIWDTDMFTYTSDNCTPDNQLKTAICKTCTSFPVDAQGQPIKAVLFNCTELGTQTVRVWSQDKAGNSDYCETYILVQDNAGNCPSSNKTVGGAAKGTDKNGVIKGAADVSVLLNIAATNSTPGLQHTITTDIDGAYAFLKSVPNASDVTITPSYDMFHLNGVDMLDVLKVQRHILGLEPLPNVYRQIAADVNNTRSITSNDIVELRKIILGATSKFPAVNSWRFVDKNFQFANPNNAFTHVFPEMITLTKVEAAFMDANFESIKTGDVTGNAQFNTADVVDDRSNGTVYFDAKQAEVTAGQEFAVEFKSATEAAACQFTMQLNGLEVLGTNLKDGDYAVHTDAMTVATEGLESFSVRFRAVKAGKLSEMISATSKITAAAAFSAAGERSEIAFRFGGIVSGAGFELMQNVPNPVKSASAISFNLPEASAATLTFTNVEGRVLKVVKAQYHKGLNTVTIDGTELESGVIFYQLDTPTHSDMKKMVIIK